MQLPYPIRKLVSQISDDALFDVYADPEDIAHKEAVKRGFSWRTFVLPLPWPSDSPIPVPAFIGTLALVSLFVPIRVSTDTNIVRAGLMCLAYLGIGFWMGRRANQWKREKLEKSGWRHVGTRDGRTLSTLIH